MKTINLFIALVLILPAAYSSVENYNGYKQLEIDINVSSFADTVLLENGGRLDFVNITAMFYPKNNYMQKVVAERYNAYPKTDVLKSQDSRGFIWRNPSLARYSFSMYYDVRTENEIIKVDKKIRFPLEALGNDLEKHTKPTKFIDLNDDIRRKAAEIAEGDDDYYSVAFKLAKWVNQNINYSLDTMTENVVEKSSWVLEHKYGVCDELTNLFISMARSLGMPGRFVSGIAYTNKGYNFGNHGWAEIYFPGYGWIPFDVTYGQYGWIDPGHVKFYDSIDSESPSVSYGWRASNVNMATYNLNVDANVSSARGIFDSGVEFEIKPLVESANFGSYFPLEIKARNKNNHYVAASFRVRKAPGIVNDSISRSMLLRPGEEKSDYWIMYTPEAGNKNYIYITEIEVADDFNQSKNAKFKYGVVYDSYGLEYAQNMAKVMEYESKEKILGDIDFYCNASGGYVYTMENVPVLCNIRNIGNKNIEGIEVCIGKICKNTSLLIGEKDVIVINNKFMENGEAAAKAKYDGKEKYSMVKANVIKKPLVALKAKDIAKIGYNEEKNLKVEMMTNTKINNVTIDIGNVQKFSIDELEGKYGVAVEVKGKMLRKQGLMIDVSYKDEAGKYYFISDKVNANVENVPWYAKLYGF